jgi:RNA polymerase sigma-70 factor (ECF subfamily)
MARNKSRDEPVSFEVSAIPSSAAAAGLESLLTALRPELIRFAQWLTRDRALAEDVVQESLLRAWRSQSDLRDRSAARAWLFTIVRREHARLYERKRLEMTTLDDAIERSASELSVEGDTELVELRLAIFRLAEEYREPLVMQVLGGFSTAEIAAELGLTLTAVLTRLHRARNQLRALCNVPPP